MNRADKWHVDGNKIVNRRDRSRYGMISFPCSEYDDIRNHQRYPTRSKLMRIDESKMIFPEHRIFRCFESIQQIERMNDCQTDEELGFKDY